MNPSVVSGLRTRFWLEICSATILGSLATLTAITRNWVEILFHFDPDGGSGSFEWLVVGALAVLTVTLLGLARSEWRRRARPRLYPCGGPSG